MPALSSICPALSRTLPCGGSGRPGRRPRERRHGRSIFPSHGL
jgi:hypothetical protein